MDNRDITIGKIVGTHGNKGMLKIVPITDFPERFLEMDRVILEIAGRQREYKIVEASAYRRYILLKLGEVPDMTAAEALRGALIKVSKDELTVLPEGSYYIFDIVGLKVYDPEGKHLGEVEDIIQTGANDVYVIKTAGPRPLLVPALKEVVRELDIKGGRMVVDYPELEG